MSNLPGTLINWSDDDPKKDPETLERQNRAAEAFGQGLVAADVLDEMDIPQREPYCGYWFRESDLGFIYGPRGEGKTWFAIGLARAVAEGRDYGPWAIKTKRKVLYVDGEMPQDGLKERDLAVKKGPGDLWFLNHERLFDQTERTLNLTDPIGQVGLLRLCEKEDIKVLIVDNLSCLFRDMAENDADDWERVLHWLLLLRRRKIAVVIVHHSGRAGSHMRGTSRREDAATWVIRLGIMPDPMKNFDGVRFVSRFTKHRQGLHSDLIDVDWSYERRDDGTHVTHSNLKPIDVFRQLVGDGLTSCSEIAEAMGMSKAGICKIAKRAEHEGWLVIKSRSYRLVDSADL